MNSDAAKNFANYWNGHGNENSDYQDFWRDLLHDVFGVERTTGFIEFQKPVTGKHIDAYISSTKVLIEHKSFGEDLDRKYRQSDGEYLTPFEQAQRYVDALPPAEKPRWIVTCNFAVFRIYDTTKNLFEREPTVIELRELRYHYKRLRFLVDPNADDKPPEEKITKDAAKIVERICLAFDKNYRRREPVFVDALRKFCMRLVFCFYADDATTFTEKKFGEYLNSVPPEQFRDAIQKVFDVLNTPEDERDDFDDELKKFPNVNGGLFDEKIDIPPLNKDLQYEIKYAHYLRKENNDKKFKWDEHGNLIKFSWREISPPIFGATFESLFKPVTQREGGMYYTDEDNILKVIKPLLLKDLRDEFDAISRKHENNDIRINKKIRLLKGFQDKLAKLTFLDPACGSGNFLTETYKALRQLENEILEELRGLNVKLPADPVKVSINQFYGIEIDPFAAAIAQVAMWIAENQMLQKTEGAIGKNLDAFPLKNYAKIKIANALRVDWLEVFDKDAPDKFDYIIGNPPFHGYSEQTPAQKADMRQIFADNRKAGKLDYVAAWYRKAADFIQGSAIRCAFVSTNSIVQGEQCSDLWKELYERLNIHIDFAYRTFKWLSDSDNMAHVHCVIVGFSVAHNDKPKKIFDGGNVEGRIVKNINAYLVDSENIFVEARRNPIQDDVPEMIYGSKVTDNGNLIIEADDYEPFIINEPDAKNFIRPFVGAEEFINGKRRYCLWLEDVPLDEIKKMPLVAERVEACRQFRLTSKKAVTRASAATPQLFQEIRQPTTNYILVPRVSSERRHYVPIAFMSPNFIASDAVHVIPDATLYHFGILTSSIHMAWVRATAGRLKSDYRYSATVVYNNFPWCAVTMRRRQMIEETAQKILDVRAKFDGWTFATLYNPQTMPQPLRDAHNMNDMAVALAYGFAEIINEEAAVVAELMKLYKRLTT